jgi:uncharacterized integral membrane protein
MTSQPTPNGDPKAPEVAPSAAPSAAALPRQHQVRRTRLGGLWIAATSFAVVLMLLLIFILQNGQRVSISYPCGHGHLPLGVALLLAAVLGVLLVLVPGTGRIIQLRLTARRHRQLDADLSNPQ